MTMPHDVGIMYDIFISEELASWIHNFGFLDFSMTVANHQNCLTSN